MSEHHRTGPLVIFWLAQILADVLVAIAAISAGPTYLPLDLFWFAIWYGISFAQVSMLGTWTASGGGSLLFRTFWTVFAGIAIWFFAFNAAPSSMMPSAILPGIAMLIQWLLIQFPLWMLRLKFGWRLDRPGKHEDASGRTKVQFGIKHLLGWMTFVAVILGVGKFLSLYANFSRAEAVEFGLFLLCNSLLALPALLTMFATRPMWWWILAVLAFAVIVTAAEPYLFTIMGSATDGTRYYLFWWLNGVQWLWIIASTTTLRLAGFRLISGCHSTHSAVE